MSVKLADTLKPMADFPVAEATDVSIEINGTDKDLQSAYEDGDLGGGQTIQVDTMPLASAENVGQTLQFIGATGTYQHGYFYECVSDGESPATYSWEQTNVQPSNAQASQVSYDNTTSELQADDVQEAIDEIVSGLGTASGKDYTDTVRPNSHDLVESMAVYSAINGALNTIYVPRGSLSCADLTSARLIEANIGSVYQMSDSGLTSALFINGAGISISAGDNVGIIKAGETEILYNYMGNAFDLTKYKKIWGPGHKADWEALSLDTRKEYDEAHFDDDDGAVSSDVYSTTETKTNKVWIDGKQIYRKVVVVNQAITADTSIPSTLPNTVDDYWINMARSYFISGADANSRLPLQYAHPLGGQYMLSTWMANRDSITVRLGSSQSASKMVIVIEYTKTT